MLYETPGSNFTQRGLNATNRRPSIYVRDKNWIARTEFKSNFSETFRDVAFRFFAEVHERFEESIDGENDFVHWLASGLTSQERQWTTNYGELRKGGHNAGNRAFPFSYL